MDVSVIILTFNNIEFTRRLVDSLSRCSGDIAFEIIFVDSGSTDGSREYFATIANAKMIAAEGAPFVFNRNLNRGIAVAEGDIVICANNDVEVLTPRTLESVCRLLRQNRLIGVLATELTPPTSQEPKPILVRGYTQGCFYAMRRNVWEDIGGLCELYTGYGCEEADLSVRLLRKGYRTGFAQGLHCHHFGNQTFRLTKTGDAAACLSNAETFSQLHGYNLNFAPNADFWDNLHGYFECVFNFEWEKGITSLEIGCGCAKPEGFVGIDLLATPAVDLVWDIRDGIPYPDHTVNIIHATNIFQYLPHPIAVMNECWRVLKPGGSLLALTPSASGPGAFGDPTVRSFWNEQTIDFFCDNPFDDSAEWRRYNGWRGHFQAERVIIRRVDDAPFIEAFLRAC